MIDDYEITERIEEPEVEYYEEDLSFVRDLKDEELLPHIPDTSEAWESVKDALLIPENYIDRYNISKRFPDDIEGIYRTFLIQTDYIANKVVEAQALGEEIDEEYTEILKIRKAVREAL